MRILHVLGIGRLPQRPDDEGVPGTSRVILELARRQRALGHEVVAGAIEADKWSTEWNGVRLLAWPRRPWARVRLGGRTLDLREQLGPFLLTRTRSFDVVHVHEYAHVANLRARARVVHVHNSPDWSLCTEPELVRRRARRFWSAARGSDAQVGVSQFVTQQLSLGFASIRETPVAQQTRLNIATIYNGVDCERFSACRLQRLRRELRRSWKVGDDDVVFLYAGAVVPDKGVIHLAQAFAAIAAQVGSAHLVIAGGAGLWGNDGGSVDASHREYENGVECVLGPWRQQGRAHLLGLTPASRIPAVYAASDVVVVPSIVQESFSLAALDALASSKPVIASRVGGMPELVSDDCGVLVPSASERALAAAMRVLAENADRRTALAARGADTAARFTWDDSVRQLERLYTRILDGGHRHAGETSQSEAASPAGASHA